MEQIKIDEGGGAIAARIMTDIVKPDAEKVAAKALEKAQERGIPPTQENLAGLIREELTASMNLAKFTGALAAFLAGQDPSVAHLTAGMSVALGLDVTVASEDERDKKILEIDYQSQEEKRHTE